MNLLIGSGINFLKIGYAMETLIVYIDLIGLCHRLIALGLLKIRS